jgi:hypothetical protein
LARRRSGSVRTQAVGGDQDGAAGPGAGVRAVYEQRSDEADHRYGQRLARRIRAQIDSIPEILAKYATFSILSALK